MKKHFSGKKYSISNILPLLKSNVFIRALLTKKQPGFTLIELMVVMAIIAILATAGLSAYTGYVKKGRDTSRAETGRAIESSVLGYMASNNGKAPSPTDLKTTLTNEGITIKDPIGDKNACLGADGVADQPCGFEYVKYDDGSYSISYGIESPESMKTSFYQATFTDAIVGETTIVGVYRGDAKFIGQPTDAAHDYIPISPGDIELLTGSNSRLDTHTGGTYTFTTTLAGDNNDITWASSYPGVTITYASPAAQATTTVAIYNKHITITPGTNIAPIIFNTTSNIQFWSAMYGSYSQQITNKVFTYYGLDINGNNEWRENASKKVYFDTGYWYWTGVGVMSGQLIILRAAGVANDDPATLTFVHAPTSEAYGGAWIMTRGTSSIASASQIIAAVASNPTASALIAGSLASGNDGTGAVTAMEQSTLSTN